MQLFDITLRGLRRRLGRMALLIVGLTVGTATVVAMMAITLNMRDAVAVRLDEYGANILIVPKASALAVTYGGISVASASYDVGEMTLADLESIHTIKNAHNVSVIAPKLLTSVPMGEQQVVLAGVRFNDEIRLKQWWQVNGDYPLDAGDALAGALLAESLGLTAGSRLEVQGHPIRIAGVLEENASQDDQILFIDLALVQEIVRQPDAINLVEVAALCIECPVEEIVEQISEVLPQARVTALRQAVTLRMETVSQLTSFAMAVTIVVVLIGALVVLMTMLGAVSERTQEIGLFRALGFRRRHIERVILGEALIVSLAGGLAGWLLGIGAAVALNPSVANMGEHITWNPWLGPGALAGTLLIGLGGSLYPAIRAARLDPATALRTL
jgi:putative ABC transport system permease protein